MSQAGAVPRGQIRESAIASTWYPGDPGLLGKTIDSYLEKANKVAVSGDLLALMAPHAGYVYSGQVAAHAYRQLVGLPEGLGFDRVVVISPSHHPYGAQVLATRKQYYETPLGLVRIDGATLETVLEKATPLRVKRLDYDDEHSLEIQLPFLQRVLPSFELVPIVLEDQTLPACRILAESLAGVLADRRALLVASTDLSHFHSYETARSLDQAFLADFERLDPVSLLRGVVEGRSEACGAGPVVTALLVARRLGATKARVLASTNSGDVTGDRWRVVGYAAGAVWK